VLGIFGRRAIDLAVLFLALYAFAFVPLGKRTGLEHARAILATRAAKRAIHEAGEAADRLRRTLLDSGDDETPLPSPLPSRGRAVVPKLPRATSPLNAALAPRNDAPDAPDAPDASL
jgi:hypothetical protein